MRWPRRSTTPTGTAWSIAGPNTERGETWRGWPHILPGGRYLLFSIWRHAAEDAEIGIRDLDTGREAILTMGLYPRYVPTGHVVFTRVDGTLMAAPLDADGLALPAEPAAIFGDLSVNTVEGYAEIAISASGTMVYRPGSSQQQQLFRVARDGSEVPVDSSFVGQFRGVSLSPDGRRLVAAVTTQSSANIYVKDLSGGPWRRVSFEPGEKLRPRWVPGQDGVTYVANDGQPGEGGPATHLLQANADGSGNARVILEAAQWLQGGVWSPDGAWLVYRVGPLEGTRRDLYALRPGDTGDTVAIAATRFDEHSPAISPDGRYLAYVSDEAGRPEVFVRPFPDVTGGKWQVSTSGGSEPVWGRTGRELFYRASNAAMTSARYEDEPSFTVVDRTELFPAGAYTADPLHPSYDVSPDDQHFLLARGDGVDEPLVLVQNWFQELLSRVEGSRNR